MRAPRRVRDDFSALPGDSARSIGSSLGSLPPLVGKWGSGASAEGSTVGSPWEALMTKPLQRDAIYLKRHFDAEIIVLSVRWYITYKLSYRDLAAMMAERSVVVWHTTIMRWVIRYAPEFEKRWRRFSRSVGCSWRVDETYIAIKGNWHYLYRAVDKLGRTVDFLLRPDRGMA